MEDQNGLWCKKIFDYVTEHIVDVDLSEPQMRGHEKILWKFRTGIKNYLDLLETPVVFSHVSLENLVEVDLVALTNNEVYLIEVKGYYGDKARGVAKKQLKKGYGFLIEEFDVKPRLIFVDNRLRIEELVEARGKGKFIRYTTDNLSKRIRTVLGRR